MFKLGKLAISSKSKAYASSSSKIYHACRLRDEEPTYGLAKDAGDHDVYAMAAEEDDTEVGLFAKTRGLS